VYKRQIQGRGGDDTILGNAGRDRLEGEAGDDNLNGGQGNDILIGGIGDDRLRGAAGRDQFWFDASLNEGTDTIVDFQDGRDLLRIEGAEFNDLILSTQVVGGDNVAIVQIGSGTVIRLEDMSHTDLDATDFIFV
jgi:Ca2+-binding RTX toxin-like protein